MMMNDYDYQTITTSAEVTAEGNLESVILEEKPKGVLDWLREGGEAPEWLRTKPATTNNQGSTAQGGVANADGGTIETNGESQPQFAKGRLPGYEDVAQEDVRVPPPCPTTRPEEIVVEDRSFDSLPVLSPAEALDALKREVKEHATWKRSALKHIQITNIEPATALHYSLETYREIRSTAYTTEPYVGQLIDSYGFPPAPWDVDCHPPGKYIEGRKQIEVPHTASMMVCGPCSGVGNSYCFFCHGNGAENCNVCQGTGMKTGIPHPSQAFAGPASAPFGGTGAPGGFGLGTPGPRPGLYRSTVGTGPCSCNNAGGGYFTPGIACPVHQRKAPPGIPPAELCFFCKGTGTKTDVDKTEHIKESGDIPMKLLKRVTGVVIFEEEKPLVNPLTKCPDKAIDVESKKAVIAHRNNALGKARIIQQRQILRLIPVAVVSYQFKNDNRQFWVYGEERKVYVKGYPDKCSIL